MLYERIKPVRGLGQDIALLLDKPGQLTRAEEQELARKLTLAQHIFGKGDVRPHLADPLEVLVPDERLLSFTR